MSTTHPDVTKLLRSLLEIMDNLERAVGALEDSGTPQSVADGVRSIHRQLTDVFYRWDLRAFTSFNTPFDPTRHEALGRANTEAVPVNHVAEEVRRGYVLGEQLFRAAQVIVNTELSAAPSPAQRAATVPVRAAERARAATRSAVNRPAWLLNPPAATERTIYLTSDVHGATTQEAAETAALDGIVPALLEWCAANLDETPLTKACEPMAWALRGSGASGLWAAFTARVPAAARWLEDQFWEKVQTEAKGAVYDHTVLIAVPRAGIGALLVDDSDEKWHGLSFANLGPLLQSALGDVEGAVVTEKNPAAAGGRQLLEPGDVVVRVGNRATPDAQSLRRMLTLSGRAFKPIDLLYVRGFGEPKRARITPPRR